MRLGKEQAVGYVEDPVTENTETDALPAQEPVVAEADGMPLTTVAEPPLTVS
jgi:hypothetical protein